MRQVQRERKVEAVLGVVIAAALVAGAALYLGRRSDEPGDVRVLGETVTRPQVSPSSSAAASPPTTASPGASGRLSTTPAPPAAPTPTAAHVASPAVPSSPRPLPEGRHSVTERNDNGYFVVVDETGAETDAGSSSQVAPGVVDDFGFAVRARASGGVITVDVSLANRTSGRVEFPGGMRVEAVIAKDGAAWRTLSISAPEILGLAPGESVSRAATTPADGSGQYAITASLETQRTERR